MHQFQPKLAKSILAVVESDSNSYKKDIPSGESGNILTSSKPLAQAKPHLTHSFAA